MQVGETTLASPRNRNITIIGAGLMGPGIATCSTLAGYQTVLVDKTSELAQAGIDRVKQNLSQLLENQLINQDQADSSLSLVQPETDLKRSVKDSFFIIEAVSENLSLKQDLFKELDSLTDTEVIITSNTSGLRITDIAKNVKHPERMATTHFWFPAHLVPLVEIVVGEKTDKSIAIYLHKLLKSWNK